LSRPSSPVVDVLHSHDAAFFVVNIGHPDDAFFFVLIVVVVPISRGYFFILMTDRPLSPKEALVARGLTPKKSFGQNFLVDATHVEAIARAVKGGLKRPLIVELGGGTGALTRALIDDAIVHVVERDRDLVPVLRTTFPFAIDEGRLTVHEADAATVDLRAIYATGGPPRALCGNLPYHLTSTLLFRAIDVATLIDRAVFLIQLEVAERVAAKPGEKNYSLLSVLCGARFDVEIAHVVPKGAFWPVPEVDGGVIALTPRKDALVDEVLWPRFKTLVKAAFAQRRKTLRNTLKKIDPGGVHMTSVGIDPGARAETITVERFAALARVVDVSAVETETVDGDVTDA
jgi:16S rRNA (adenine1518-N6/adenine1519-N6)-dimethyltransferase